MRVDSHPPTLAAALARLAAVEPEAYARTRNALDGAVSGLSPYLTHGFITLEDALATVVARHPLPVEHRWVFELGWRGYFRHVWSHRGAGILQSLHAGPLPDSAYAHSLPEDVALGCTGVPVIDHAVRTLYDTGWLHNHARLWLASYLVHVRKVHWRVGAAWLVGHLLDGDLASNHLSWQWVAGTGSSKPYLFNADNVARFAPLAWHSPGTAIDTSYETLTAWARGEAVGALLGHGATEPEGLAWAARVGPNSEGTEPPPLWSTPPEHLGWVSPDAAAVADQEVWLVHPWSLGALPADLPPHTRVLGVAVAEFHRAWPWSPQRWAFVGQRMAELTPVCWWGPAAALRAALAGARRVRGWADPHNGPGTGVLAAGWAGPRCEWMQPPALFAPQDRLHPSFSKWWAAVTRGRHDATELLPPGVRSASGPSGPAMFQPLFSESVG